MDASAFFRYPEEEVRAAANAFLANLAEDDVATVLRFMQSRRYRAGELAARAGDHDRSLFIIVDGRFEVLAAGPSGPVRAQVLQPGEIFGELSFFDREPRSADVRAAVDGGALVLTPTGFDRLRVVQPRLALFLVLDLARVLSLRFRAANRMLTGMGRL